jgi:hypothetical protein
MRIYLHREGRLEAEVVEAPETATLADLLGEAADGVLFLREDDDMAFKADVTLARAGIADRSHVFAGKKGKIDIEVQFNGVTHSREFSASTRVEQVFKWAAEEFNLSKGDAAEHTLSVAATGDIPAGDVLIGSLPQDPAEHLLFSLVPKHRYEG